MIKFITTASEAVKCDMLARSLQKHGWEYHFIIHPWLGFGCKIIETYKYLKANPDITHFFYSDAYDSVVLGTMEEALSKIPDKDIILQSAERACYPHPEKEALYPKHDSPWHFVNGGGWFASSDLFCKMVEAVPIQTHEVDQVYFTDRFLEGVHGMILDYNCDVFQTIAFCPESDFERIIQPFNDGVILSIEDGMIIGDPQFRIRNTINDTMPLFIHGNGHTPMTEIYKLI